MVRQTPGPAHISSPTLGNTPISKKRGPGYRINIQFWPLFSECVEIAKLLNQPLTANFRMGRMGESAANFGFTDKQS
jgi:hypothetical protein